MSFFYVHVTRAFLKSDPKSAKKTETLIVFWGLSGSARSKAAR